MEPAPSSTPQHEYCPYLHHTMELIGRRWTGVILWTLANGPTRFAEIRSAIPGLSDRLLTDRLVELEGEGIVGRCDQDGASCYRLTDKGEQVVPVLEAAAAVASGWACDESPADRPGRIRAGGCG
ncbi:MAG: helix-turn-helix domain-containing protein [Actinomycetota bacterium]